MIRIAACGGRRGANAPADADLAREFQLYWQQEKQIIADGAERIIVVDKDRHVLGIITSLDLLKEFPA